MNEMLKGIIEIIYSKLSIKEMDKRTAFDILKTYVRPPYCYGVHLWLKNRSNTALIALHFIYTCFLKT